MKQGNWYNISTERLYKSNIEQDARAFFYQQMEVKHGQRI